jgi:predicted DNA-binding protein YlxM (UPF0122 family)
VQYTWREKRDRNQAIIDYAKSHPGYALSEIAQFFNLSRQRVFTILKKSGVKYG